jgi:hypothetical protein
MSIGIYNKINEYSETILSAMLYINFYIVKTSKAVIGLDINSALIRNLLLTITLIIINTYLEKEMRGATIMDSGYVLG